MNVYVYILSRTYVIFYISIPPKLDWFQGKAAAWTEAKGAKSAADTKPRWGENVSSRRRSGSSTSNSIQERSRPSTASSMSGIIPTSKTTRSAELRAQYTANIFSSFTNLSGQRYKLSDGERGNPPFGEDESRGENEVNTDDGDVVVEGLATELSWLETLPDNYDDEMEPWR